MAPKRGPTHYAMVTNTTDLSFIFWDLNSPTCRRNCLSLSDTSPCLTAPSLSLSLRRTRTHTHSLSLSLSLSGLWWWPSLSSMAISHAIHVHLPMPFMIQLIKVIVQFPRTRAAISLVLLETLETFLSKDSFWAKYNFQEVNYFVNFSENIKSYLINTQKVIFSRK